METKKDLRKQNKAILLLVILAIISLIALMSSFARYTGVAGTAEDTAKIAKWSVTLDTQTNSIFTHEYTKNLVSGAGTNKIIAPGVSGEYEIAITNAGDVSAKITGISLTQTGAVVPLQFSIDSGATWTDLSGISTKLTNAATALGVVAPGASSSTLATLQWRWPFDSTEDTASNDVIDTALGANSTATTNRSDYTLTLKVTASQEKPAK